MTTTARTSVTGRLGCALLGAALLALGPQPASAEPFDDVLRAARKEATEGKFVSMVSSPKGEAGQRAIMEAFQKRFNLKLDWEWLPLTSPVSGPRVVEQAKSGVRLPTVIGGYPYALYEHWIVKNNLAEPVDWVGIFGKQFPAIKRAATDTVIGPYQGRLLRQWDVAYVMVYNTSLLNPAEVPTDIEALTTPAWRGKFAMSNNSAPPLDILAVANGQDKMLALMRRLMANEPRYKPGPPAVVGAVANGEVAIAVGGYSALADALKAKGAPVDWKPMATVPLGPLFVYALRGSPQPNLGKLFLAWLVTEGAEVQDRAEFLGVVADPNSRVSKRLREMAPSAKLVEAKSPDDLKLLSDTTFKMLKLLTDTGVRAQ
jgi:iron(III) transport system substrate-binding protein